MRCRLFATFLLVVSALAGCSSEPGPTAASCETTPNGTLESSVYRTGMTPVRTPGFAVATANPLATEAACRVLAHGGTAADALVTAQTILGLVEPQASGIGGGAFLLYYDASTRQVDAYDGRETAPAAATEDYLRWISDTDRTAPRPTARASGRSIGVPGVVRLLDLVHREHGKNAWKELFSPAITLADDGFRISPRMAGQIAENVDDLARDDNARSYFLTPDGKPKPVNDVLVNPAMAKTLGAIATDGADAFYTGAIAADIVQAAADGAGDRTPGLLSAGDLASYQAKKRTAICTDYRTQVVCGMPGPSSGGIAVAQTLGILEHFDLASLGPDLGAPDSDFRRNGGKPKPEAVHLIAEAERLAYADRGKYVADPDFVPLPGNSPNALVDDGYLKSRAALIDPKRAMESVEPGDFGPAGIGAQPPEHGTSHISIVDRYGNAASMTTSVESAFGSFHVVDGFVLNNQLTDFSAEPTGPDGQPIANRVEAGKRPRSSMSPTLIFERAPDGARGQLTYVTGSPGGAAIIQFVVKTVVELVDWHLDAQQAASGVNFGAGTSATVAVGGEHPAIDASDNGNRDSLVQGLRALGHEVSVAPQISGLSVLSRDGEVWVGGADPRREGLVAGG